MTQWYVQKPSDDPTQINEMIGPLKPAELLKLVRQGDVVPESLVRKDDSAWFEAREVGGLFEAAMRPTISYFCHQCEAPITEPPVECPKCGAAVQKEQARRLIKENSILRKEDQTLTGQASKSMQKWLRKKGRKKEGGA